MPPEQLEFASPEDRGDNIPVAAPQANAPAAKMEEPPKVDEPRDEDPPRDEGGKFAKHQINMDDLRNESKSRKLLRRVTG